MAGERRGRGRGKKLAETLVLNIIKGEGSVPIEAIETQLCELFHCRPSELDEEDGFRCLRMLYLHHWREVALAYKNDPKSISAEDRTRITLLLGGKEDALTMELRPKTKIDKLKDIVSGLKSND